MVLKIFVKVGEYLCRNRDGFFSSRINKVIRLLYFKIENDNHDLATNGERRVLYQLSKQKLKFFFDVGARHGEWTQFVKSINPNASVYSFEASPITFSILKNNIGNLPGVKLINQGLYNSNGVLDFYQSSDDWLSSLMLTSQHTNAQKIGVQVTTIDDFCKENEINEIDFLKIDTEGADYNVLLGAQNMLKEHKIKVIQFEYGFVSVESENLLKRHYSLLESFNYTLGKVFPKSVEFSPYFPSMENFIGPNILAVRNDLQEIIKILK